MGKSAAKAKITSNTAGLAGFEGEVDRLVSAHAARDAADATISEIRGTLDTIAREERRALEAGGVRTKQITILGTGKPARYTFPDRYKPLAPTLAADLSALVGPDIFGRLFASVEGVQLRAGVDLAALVAMIPALGAYVETTTEIRATEGMGDKRAAVRAALTDAQNAALDHAIEQISPAPSLSVK